MRRDVSSGRWGVLIHHIYEYKKGLRNLILHTDSMDNKTKIIERLEKSNVPYHITKVSENKINVFFGSKICLDVVREIAVKPLNELSDEEDYILGIMLGYDIKKQCYRFLKRKNKYPVGSLIG